MAISRDKKQALVTELSQLFETAKGTVAAAYTGLSVAHIEELRAQAREAEITIKVVKNRLVRVALAASETYKSADSSALTGQLVYAFSATDEVAPAQLLAQFSKKNPALQLVAGFDASGVALSTQEVKALAELPTKDQLRGMVVATIAAPLTSFLGVANGAQRGFAQVLSQRAEQL